MDIGALFVCSHCGLKMFFPGDAAHAGNSVASAFKYGWQTIDTADQNLELCPTCYKDYSGMIRAFRVGITYRMPNRDNSGIFQIYKESDNNGSEQPAQEQPTLEPADTSADSIARAEAIREAGGDRCQGLQTERDVRKEAPERINITWRG